MGQIQDEKKTKDKMPKGMKRMYINYPKFVTYKVLQWNLSRHNNVGLWLIFVEVVVFFYGCVIILPNEIIRVVIINDKIYNIL